VLSAYHLEASIAAQYCTAPTYADTNWTQIFALTERLLVLRPTPVIQLNLAIVAGRAFGVDEGLRRLRAIERDKRLRDYPWLHATLGVLYQERGDLAVAAGYLRRAIALTESTPERALLEARLSACASSPH
jgi:RNA polymerase sigma-70 factor (ECF subfamily)